MQRRILDGEIAVAHAAAHMHDGVARHAPQAVLRFGRVYLFLHWAVETAIEKHGVVVTPRAPLAPLRAAQFLHVKNGAAIELVIERREVVHGRLPLFVDVLMTLAA